MCADPGSLALISTALSATGAGVSAVGSIQQGRAAQVQAEQNARMQERAARQQLAAGEEEARRRVEAARQQRGQQAVGLAANGQDVTYGDPAGLLDETMDYGIEDALTIRENSRSQANNMAQSAANQRTQGRAARSNSRYAATGTILGGAARVGQQYAGWAADRYGQQEFS